MPNFLSGLFIFLTIIYGRLNFHVAHSFISECLSSGSLSVNVSITSGKDEFVNAGQLSVSSGSSSSVLLKLVNKSNNALLLHILVIVGLLFL